MMIAYGSRPAKVASAPAGSRTKPAEDAFWTTQAAHYLNAFLWDNGRIPPNRRLTIDTRGINRDVL
jgi:hypothetical protein